MIDSTQATNPEKEKNSLNGRLPANFRATHNHPVRHGVVHSVIGVHAVRRYFFTRACNADLYVIFFIYVIFFACFVVFVCCCCFF